MIRNLILDRQPAKPTIGEVHLHIAAQRSLRADRERVADDQHPDHQFRVNRWPTSTGIIRRQLNTHPRQVEYRSYLANQVIVRNSLFKTKWIKQLPLVVIEPPHHPPQRIASQRPNHFERRPSIAFATKSAQSGLTSTILCLSAFGAKPTCTVVKLAPPDRERGTQTAAMCSRCDRSLRQRYAARDLQAQRRDPSRH